MGPYEIERTLGTGGMGTVLVARHRQLQRRVALKVIDSSRIDQEEVRARFTTEARLMARLTHPNVVKLFDFGEENGSLYIAMELLEGCTLLARLESLPPLTAQEVRRFCCSIASGASALHQAGIVHGDLKPENLFLTSDGVLKLLDFGLARSPDLATLPGTGRISGTPRYLPPETVTGRSRSPSFDVFQVGLLLHRIVTGQEGFVEPPFAYALADQPLPPPSILSLGREFGGLDTIIVKCLEQNPQDRYQSGGELERALEGVDWPIESRTSTPERQATRDSGARPPAAPQRGTSRRKRPSAAAERPVRALRSWAVAAGAVTACITLAIVLALATRQPAPAPPVSPRPTPTASSAARDDGRLATVNRRLEETFARFALHERELVCPIESTMRVGEEDFTRTLTLAKRLAEVNAKDLSAFKEMMDDLDDLVRSAREPSSPVVRDTDGALPRMRELLGISDRLLVALERSHSGHLQAWLRQEHAITLSTVMAGFGRTAVGLPGLHEALAEHPFRRDGLRLFRAYVPVVREVATRIDTDRESGLADLAAVLDDLHQTGRAWAFARFDRATESEAHGLSALLVRTLAGSSEDSAVPTLAITFWRWGMDGAGAKGMKDLLDLSKQQLSLYRRLKPTLADRLAPLEKELGWTLESLARAGSRKAHPPDSR